MLTKDEEKIVTSQDEDQVFGDNDRVARINIKERLKKIVSRKISGRHIKSILNAAKDVRNKLNHHKNEVRDYCRDARQTPMA